MSSAISKIRSFLRPPISREFRLTAYAQTRNKVVLACKITILLWLLTTPLEIVLVPERMIYFFGIRIVVILISIGLLFYARRSPPRKSYSIVVMLFAVITSGFIGFSYLFPEGLEVINQAFLSFVFLLGLSVVWPPLYTLVLGMVIVTSTLTFQYLTAGGGQKLFIDTVYLYSAMLVATIITQLSYRLQESNFETHDQLDRLRNEKALNESMRSELEKLNKFSQLINEQTDLLGILEFIHIHFKREFGIDIVWLLAVDERKGKVQSVHLVTDAEDALGREARAHLENFSTTLEAGSSSFARTYELGLPHYVRNVRDKLDNPVDLGIANKAGLTGFLQVPIRIEGTVVAIVDLRSVGGGPEISALDMARVNRFCEQIAGAINASTLIAKLNTEQELNESLIRNILPAKVAEELKIAGHVQPLEFDSVTVLFTDFVGFTRISEQLSPDDLVKELDGCFTQFDEIVQRHGMEKLKTIGDAYMCAAGMPDKNFTHPVDACLAALEFENFMKQMQEIKQSIAVDYWELRIGIHTGPAIAGVVGKHKFAYDIWGDTVNTASRLESSGIPGRVNISRTTYEIVKYFFDCKSRGQVQTKGKGLMDMFLLRRIRPHLSVNGEGFIPNDVFMQYYDKIKAGARLAFRSETQT